MVRHMSSMGPHFRIAGTSGLLRGGRRSKADDVFDCLGSLDELSAQLGLARETGQFADRPELGSLSERILFIQSWLLDMGACVAVQRAGDDVEAAEDAPAFDEGVPSLLEQWIDEMEASLPPLTNFILPVCNFTASSSVHHFDSPHRPPCLFPAL